ncbi:substrate-binding domain-containing protein [Streptomyces sp. NPDC046928]|uniref:substrate-binding domain-containing protein n=1 Tax=Streptomyces sp. NPDC046928 TaxID=3155021 RepID=UPI00340C33F4
MRTRIRDTAVALVAASTAVALAACGSDGAGGAGDGTGPKIGILLPDNTTARWETQDRPLLEKEIEKRCGDCTVVAANAKADVAAQQQQMDSMIANGADALLLVAVDARAMASAVRKAEEAGIPVIAYDRLTDGPIAGHVSFDGEEVGRLQGTALLKAMGDEVPGAQIVMMNGDLSDPNAVLFKRGALSVLRGKVKIGKTYDTLQWRPEAANQNMSAAIAALGGDSIDGVYAANDGLAAGSISALRANQVRPLPPVTGQDAELGAIRRIVKGTQYMTVYKPFLPEATAGAEMAVAAARGENLDRVADDEVTTRDGHEVPTVTLTPVSVTVNNIKDTVVKDGVYTVRQICVPDLAAACRTAGLT